MRERCRCITNKRYSRYGGRGIKVCDEWNNSYLVFQKWALENGYKEGLTIDRINNDGNYEPDNCRWVDYNIQNNNFSRNKNYTYNGKTQSLSQWARELGLHRNTLDYRLSKGWSVEEAFQTYPNDTYHYKTKTVKHRIIK